jgi:hypothetical protein
VFITQAVGNQRALKKTRALSSNTSQINKQVGKIIRVFMSVANTHSGGRV